MTAHEAHKPLDGNERHHKGDDAAHAQDGDLVGAEGTALNKVLDQLERTCAKHNGNSQEERELRRHRACAAQQQAADDSGTGARCARNQRKYLEATDTQRGLPAQIFERSDGAKVQAIVIVCGGSRSGRGKMRTSGASARHHGTRTERTGKSGLIALVRAPVLNHDKQHAVHNERQRHDGSIVEMLFHPVVERQTDRRGGNAAEHNLAPQHPGVATALLALAGRKRVKVVEEQDADGQNGAKLNHDQKHIPERLAHVHLDELVHQDHVTRRRNGQPFGDALDQTHESRF